MPRKAENSLYLVGDGDDVDLLTDIEAAFDLTLSDDEAANLYTLGDLNDMLSTKLKATEGRHEVCLTAVAFHRLRRALAKLSGIPDVGPRTNLKEILPDRKFSRLKPVIEDLSGLQLPAPEMGDAASILTLLLMFGTPVLALVSGLLIGQWAWAVLLLWVLLVPLFKFAANQLPHHCSNVGSLAKAIAVLNQGRFAAEFGFSHRDDIWKALADIIDYHGLSRKPVDRQTTFFASAKS